MLQECNHIFPHIINLYGIQSRVFFQRHFCPLVVIIHKQIHIGIFRFQVPLCGITLSACTVEHLCDLHTERLLDLGNRHFCTVTAVLHIGNHIHRAFIAVCFFQTLKRRCCIFCGSHPRLRCILRVFGCSASRQTNNCCGSQTDFCCSEKVLHFLTLYPTQFLHGYPFCFYCSEKQFSLQGECQCFRKI